MSHHHGGPSAAQALQYLIEGNKRFAAEKSANPDLSTSRRAQLLTEGQQPFAVILSCSDSRLPPELIFNQGMGDLFIIRVAGNIVDSLALGSIEYGVEHLGTPLLVILGHDNCGAVKATIDGGEAPGSIGAIVEKIQPIADQARQMGLSGDALYRQTEDANITAVLAEVEKSPVIQHLKEHQGLQVIGAKYHLDTGLVDFLGL